MLKKILCLASLAFLVQVAFAQKSEVVSAYNYLNYKELDKAKESIDKASVHENSKGMSKTWYYRGLVYDAIANDPKFSSLDPNATTVAYESFTKSLEIEPKSDYVEDIYAHLPNIGNKLFNNAVADLNKAKYQDAINEFATARKVFTTLKISDKDSTKMFTILYSAYAAERGKDNAKAKEFYKQLMDMKYNDSRIYISMAKIYESEKDTAKEMATIREGRKLFPKDDYLMKSELNHYLQGGTNSKATIEKLNQAIAADPKNATLYYNLGFFYDQGKDVANATEAYKKAIEMDPKYFDAYYNLGALIFNQAAEMNNKANDLKSNTEYEKAKKKVDARFKEALPYLEKAHEINPQDKNTMITLKQLYVRIGDLAKASELKKQLEGK